MGKLAGKVAVITGAGGAIGRVSAQVFGAEGARVVCSDINAQGAEAATSDITSAGGEAFAEAIDITSDAECERLAQAAIKRYGQIDVLLHCPGVTHIGTALTCDRAAWDRQININLTGTWLMCKAVLPNMIENKAGSIITLSSLAGITGLPETFAYGVAKAGMIGLTQSLAADFSQYHIRCNTICPGMVPTALSYGHYERAGLYAPKNPQAFMERMGKRYPVKMLGKPEGVAGLALYLASDDSEFMTGQAFRYDGGATSVAWQPGN